VQECLFEKFCNLEVSKSKSAVQKTSCDTCQDYYTHHRIKAPKLFKSTYLSCPTMGKKAQMKCVRGGRPVHELVKGRGPQIKYMCFIFKLLSSVKK